MRTFLRALATAILFGVFGSAQAGVVVDPTQPVAGVSQLELSQQWWQWALGIPAPTNPLLDTTGAFAQTNNNGPVFFLGGNTGGSTTRSFTVPAGTPLFFPILNAVDIEFQPAPDCPAHPGDPLSCAFDFITYVNSASNLHATLDGQDLLTFPSFRQTSTSFFTVVLPADDAFGFGLPPGPYDAISDGFWVALDGLTPGQHTLVFGGEFTDLGFALEVTDILRVPEPGTLSLMLLGTLAAFGRRCWRARESARS